MFAVIPAGATVKSVSRGPINPSLITLIDPLVGYDVKHRSLQEVRITSIQELELDECYEFMMPAGKSLLSVNNTVLTVDGLVPVLKAPSHFYGFCILNPTKLSVRPFHMLLEAPQAVYRVEWAGDSMLWSEGILIGSS